MFRILRMLSFRCNIKEIRAGVLALRSSAFSSLSSALPQNGPWLSPPGQGLVKTLWRLYVEQAAHISWSAHEDSRFNAGLQWLNPWSEGLPVMPV